MNNIENMFAERFTPQEDENYVENFLQKAQTNIDKRLLEDDEDYQDTRIIMYGLLDLHTPNEILDILNLLIKRYTIMNRESLNYSSNFYIVAIIEYVQDRKVNFNINTTSYTQSESEEWFDKSKRPYFAFDANHKLVQIIDNFDRKSSNLNKGE
tara:strand:+ start:4485 stop:4946 length:462 start_codon:yes stop_codon:yes gene_type:complete